MRGNRQVSVHEVWNTQQIYEDARKMHRTKIVSGNIGKWRKRQLGGPDLVIRMDRQGEVLIWCRECSGCARQRMGPILMNCCKPEQVGTKEYGKMLKRIQVLEDGRVPTKEARNWKLEGQKKRITRKKYQRLKKKVEMACFMAQRGLESRQRKVLQGRGVLPQEEGDVIREFQAVHEENFPSSRLREEGKDKVNGLFDVERRGRQRVQKFGGRN